MPTLLTLLKFVAVLAWVLYLVVRFVKGRSAPPEKQESPLVEALRSSGERHQVVFEHCVFKDSSYTSNPPSGPPDLTATVLVAVAGVHGDGASEGPREHYQSELFYTHPGFHSGTTFHQTFPMDREAVMLHVSGGSMVLYVDRSNTRWYCFRVERE